jgi:SecD/SecF fusion protein
MKKYLSWKLLSILFFALLLGFFDLPGETQTKILPFTPDSIAETKVRLGLDLQGGSQLDYKIDLRKVPAADQEEIVNGVQEVIEKRVNALGVSEPNIYQSEIAGETHIIVELANTADIEQSDVDLYLGEEKLLEELNEDEKKLVSLEKAKATVGKTIQLEFKEEKSTLNVQESEEVRELAAAALERINNGEEYEVVGQEEMQAFSGKVTFDNSDWVFENDLQPAIKDALLSLEVGQYLDGLVDMEGNFVIDESGAAIQETGFGIVKLVETREEIKNEKEVDVSHILIAWSGLDNADATVTRTEEEALILTNELLEKIEAGADFTDVAKANSDDSSNAEDGGKLFDPVTGDGKYVFDFEAASLAFTESGQLSDVLRTQFGYHIIKADEIRSDVKETQYKYEAINYSTKPDSWEDTGLTGEHFVHADVQLDQFFQPYVSIQFNDEGGDLFAELTGNNINKRIAIFVGGELISAPNVQQKIVGGQAQITGQFTNEEAQTLARDLNTGAIPAPIVLTGEYTIGATLGQQALDQSMKAGLIGIILVMLFMTLYYKLPGIIASTSLLVYGIILIFLIKAQLSVGAALAVSLVVFGFLVTKIVNNRDSGLEKLLSFLLACIGFFFVTFLLKTGVVLTLAGIAGIILSVGMAVDANILIFERFKEELRDGKSMNNAIDVGFHRAWSAIRDSNFSTLLTCAILFYFGSSIIRGFAFNLAAGILVSMFTAITITRTVLKSFVGTALANNPKAFGVKEKISLTKFKFIEKTKTWFSFSGTLMVLSIIAILTFGVNLGIDFKGGTLMEFQFEEKIEKEFLADNLRTVEEEINSGDIEFEVTEEESTEEEPEEEVAVVDENTATLSAPSDTLDLHNVQILESGDTSYVIKTKYLSSEDHTLVVSKLKERLPTFTEPRFNTIGPVIGKTLLHKAVIAIIFALIMIIVYVAFAFRKVPKEVNPWRFGCCAIAALVHDVLIVTGVFVVLGQFLDIEINALFVTAMLTVFGYSVNDTIVVFDRLRENLIHHANKSLKDNANTALRETLARSLNTSISTLLALIAVLFFGSPSIFYFILALTIGAAIGTYSSIFVATPLLVLWNKKAAKKK